MKPKRKRMSVGEWVRVAPGLFHRKLKNGATEQKIVRAEIPEEYQKRFAEWDAQASVIPAGSGTLSTVNPLRQTENLDRWWVNVVPVINVDPVIDDPAAEERLNATVNRMEQLVEKLEPRPDADIRLPPEITLDPTEVAILKALAPGVRLTQETLEGRVRAWKNGRETYVSRNTISNRLKRLREAGLTERPPSGRGGESITRAGADALLRIETPKH